MNDMTISTWKTGFDVQIRNDGDLIFLRDYQCGLETSYQKEDAAEDTPYFTDILRGLTERFSVDTMRIQPGSPENDIEAMRSFEQKCRMEPEIASRLERADIQLTESDLEGLSKDAGLNL